MWKWYKFIKTSQILLISILNILFTGSQTSTERPVSFKLGNLQNLKRLMEHVKNGCQNVFNKKERPIPYAIPVCYLEFTAFAILTYGHGMCRCNPLSFAGEVWNGEEALGRTSKRKEEGIFHVIFVAIELHPTTVFFQHFLIFSQYPDNNIKIKT